MNPHPALDPLGPPQFPDEKFDQQPRHLLTVESEGEDVLLSLDCPFGNSVYASSYPTIEETWKSGPGFSDGGWPARLGQHTEGYCSMPPWIRPLYVFTVRGAVLHMQHVAAGQCTLEYEAEQVGIDELMEDNEAYLQDGVYPVVFWSDGWGEEYTCGIEVEHFKRVPLD